MAVYRRGRQRSRRRIVSQIGASLAALVVAMLIPSRAGAVCDVIPQVKNSFRGALGSLQRPFASPDDVLSIALDHTPGGCEELSPGFDPTPSNNVVTLVFEPPGGASEAVIVVENAAVCTGIVNAQLAACNAALSGGGSSSCVVATNFDLSGDVLSFAFPNTDDRAGAPADLRTLTGPLSVAVTPLGTALPCGLATSRCADGGAPAGMRACIDELYETDGTCDSSAVSLHSSFSHLTALPVPNDFQQMCVAGPPTPCVGSTPEVRLTVDAAGNLLMPMDWQGVLVPGALPIPRIVDMSSDVDAFTSAPGVPITIPGDVFLQAYSTQGHRLPPIFAPLADPAGDAKAFGSVDAPRGVTRLLRRSPVFRECVAGDHAGLPCVDAEDCPNGSCDPATCRGGSNDGAPCAGDAQCPGGECGPGLFDFSDRLSESGVGPVLLAGASYAAGAENPVPLDGLAETDDLFMFVRSELVDGEDLNGDGDQLDRAVVTLRDKQTGAEQPIGDASSPGLKTASARIFPTERPAVAVEDDILALVQVDTCFEDAGECDTTVPHPLLATALRVFRLDAAGTPRDLLAAAEPADPAPVVGSRPLAVSDGLVFYRAAEAASSGTRTQLLTGNPRTGSFRVPMSADGRFLAYVADDPSFDTRAYVLDRDPDGDGAFAAPPSNEVTIEVSIDSSGTPGSTCPFGSCGGPPQIDLTPSGRWVVFASEFTDLVPSDTNDLRDVFLHDRDADSDGVFDDEGDGYAPGEVSTQLVSLTPAGTQFTNPPGSEWPSISADGRHIAFHGCEAFECGLYIRDRDPDGNGIFDETGPGQPVTAPRYDFNVTSFGTPISADGRYLLLEDGGNPSQVIVLDRDVDADGVFDEAGETATVTVSVNDEGVAGNNFSNPTAISADGRFVAFTSDATNLRPGDDNNEPDSFVHDRDADADGIFDEPGAIQTRWVAHSVSFSLALTRDGRYVAYHDLLGLQGDPPPTRVQDGATGMTEAVVDSFFPTFGGDAISISDGGRLVSVLSSTQIDVSGVDMTSPSSADLSGDMDNDDTLLVVLDARNAGVGAGVPAALTPAEDVAVAGGHAVWLEPESANGAVLNADGDASDRVVRLYRNRQAGAAVNLGIAAEAVVLSPSWIAALVSEAGEGLDLNGDGDQEDLVAHVNPLATATAATWVNTGQAADALAVAGAWIAFTTPEWAQEGAPGCTATCDLNGDFDNGDRVLQVWDAQAAGLLAFQDPAQTPIPPSAAEDFVLGDGLLAFRASEADQACAPACNGDDDADDFVMFVVDLASGTLLNTEQAAVRCPLEACDPTVPYRINGDTLTFLTLEPDQSGTFTPGTRCVDLGGGLCDLNGDGDAIDVILQHFNAAEALIASAPASQCVSTLASASTGICTDTAAGCASDAECPAGTCYLPPGGCIRDLGISCDFVDPPECGAGEFCEPDLFMPGTGTCHVNDGSCSSDADCLIAGAVCRDGVDDLAAISAPFLGKSDGTQAVVVTGVCLGPGGVQDGTCAIAADCAPGFTCESELTQTGIADSDGDLLADSIDNCPFLPNTAQADLDADGIGDACDLQTCGDGVQSYAEGCDDGNQMPGDGCDLACQIEGGLLACDNGLDDDGDGDVDLADGGCTGPGDASEREAGIACDDGVDNDGDRKVDFPADPGCLDAAATNEAPQCNDGVDNDADSFADHPADPDCGSASDDSEAGPACGDGIDNDGDGLVDFAGGDPGCASATDDTETDPGLPCDDGLDNDGDNLVDTQDPACSSGNPYAPDPSAPNELRACQDGLDNESDGKIDFDGGASLDQDMDGFIDAAFNPATPPVGAADTQCVNRPWKNTEGGGGGRRCGLGFELALLLPLLLGLRIRRRGAPAHVPRSAR